MKTKFYLLILLLFLFSCEEENNNEDIDSQNDSLTPAELIENISTNHNQLTIEGKDIWIREEPFTGDVIMKLNTGDVCKIIEKGEKVQLRDMYDHWYKIEFEGKTGWVFGSQTNLKTGEKIEIMDFSEFLTEFIEAFNDETVNLNHFAHVKIGSSFLYNPGAYCMGGNSDMIKRTFGKKIPVKNSFDQRPKGDFCEGYPGMKDGFYYYKISTNELPKFVEDFDEEGGVITGTIDIPNQYINNELKEVIVITEEYHYAYLYFIYIEDMWYLICQNFCDCSA